MQTQGPVKPSSRPDSAFVARVDGDGLASEARYRAVVESALDAIVTVNTPGDIVGWNRGAERMFGYDESEVMNRPLTMLMPALYRERHVAGIARLRSGGEIHIIGRAAVELVGLHKDGREFPIELAVARWEGPGGWVFTGIIRDITARKMAETRLQQTNAKLEVVNRERREQRQREALIRDLHDGIGGITANIGMMAALGQKAVGTAAKDAIMARIAQLAREGSSEVRTMMTAMDSRDLRWADALVEMRRFSVMALEEHGIGFSLCITGEPSEPELGLFSWMSLFRIFREAINNVVKHSGASVVEVRVAFSAGSLELSIRDDGRGIPSELRPGRGLGSMRQRSRLLGGVMQFRPSKGTELVFALPIPLKSPDEGMDITL